MATFNFTAFCTDLKWALLTLLSEIIQRALLLSPTHQIHLGSSVMIFQPQFSSCRLKILFKYFKKFLSSHIFVCQ
jgi:hypothetical protein